MFEFKFSDIGEGLEEGKIANILVHEGAKINEGDAVFSIETDKVTTDIPAPVPGVISKILVKIGDQIRVGQLLAYIDDNVTANIQQQNFVNNNNAMPQHLPYIPQTPQPYIQQTPQPYIPQTPQPYIPQTPQPYIQQTPQTPIYNTINFQQDHNVEKHNSSSASVVGEVKTSNKILPLFGSQKLF